MKSPHELQELILHVAPKIWEQYKDLFSDKIGQLPPISFVSKKSNSLGFAYYSGKVEFNLAYLCFIPWEQTKETVAHELAHIITNWVIEVFIVGFAAMILVSHP